MLANISSFVGNAQASATKTGENTIAARQVASPGFKLYQCISGTPLPTMAIFRDRRT